MSIEREYVRGLRDVAACETRLSFVDPLGALYYVGYDIDRLLGRICYEELVLIITHDYSPLGILGFLAKADNTIHKPK